MTEKADMTDVEEEADVEDLLQYLIAKCRYESLEAHHEKTREALARIEESIHPIIGRVIADYEADMTDENPFWIIDFWFTSGRKDIEIVVQAPTCAEALTKAIVQIQVALEDDKRFHSAHISRYDEDNNDELLLA